MGLLGCVITAYSHSSLNQSGWNASRATAHFMGSAAPVICGRELAVALETVLHKHDITTSSRPFQTPPPPNFAGRMEEQIMHCNADASGGAAAAAHPCRAKRRSTGFRHVL